jgi:hypothetical protein
VTGQGTRNTNSRRSRLPRLIRVAGQRCNFCGSLTTTAAVAAGREPTATVICPSCVDRAALQLFKPGGGDAA